MKVAIEGCCHGELDNIYSQIAHLEKKNAYKVDLLLICGDFQSIRNQADLQCMAVPQKYRQLGGYYTGEKVAPVLTIVIGGNHEASNHLYELFHGGFLAPNIYYLGSSGCIRVNGLRIAGSSGIYNHAHFNMGHHESLPYTDSSLRSIYHIRSYGLSKLSYLTLTSPIDLFMSHDWPQGIEHYGNLAWLLKTKPFFKSDIQSGRLGSPPNMRLLKELKPRWWFSAHLHVRFEALVNHGVGNPDEIVVEGDEVVGRGMEPNPDEIVMDDEEFATPEVVSSNTSIPPNGAPSAPLTNPEEIAVIDDEEFTRQPEVPDTNSQVPAVPSIPKPEAATTRFLALDKCLPRRQYLEVIDIDVPTPTSTPMMTFDPEWLAISRAFHPFLSLEKQQARLPEPEAMRAVIVKELEWVKKHVGERRVEDVQRFRMTAPGPGPAKGKGNQQPPAYLNPQTEAFCEMIGVENKINPDGLRTAFIPRAPAPAPTTSEEIMPLETSVSDI